MTRLGWGSRGPLGKGDSQLKDKDLNSSIRSEIVLGEAAWGVEM